MCGARRGHGAITARPARCECPHTHGNTAQSVAPVFPARRGFSSAHSRSRLPVSSPCSVGVQVRLSRRGHGSRPAQRGVMKAFHTGVGRCSVGSAQNSCVVVVAAASSAIWPQTAPVRGRGSARGSVPRCARAHPGACLGDILRKAAAHLLGRVLWERAWGLRFLPEDGVWPEGLVAALRPPCAADLHRSHTTSSSSVHPARWLRPPAVCGSSVSRPGRHAGSDSFLRAVPVCPCTCVCTSVMSADADHVSQPTGVCALCARL